MSDSEEDYDDSEEEEEEEDEEEEGEEEESEEVKKQETVKEDIAMLMDVFGYIDRTSKRLVNRLENENANSNRGASGGGVKSTKYSKPAPVSPDSDHRGGNGGDDDFGDNSTPHELNGGWSQYEYMNDADRGLLLEKAILALGINDNDDGHAQIQQDRAQYESDAQPATRSTRTRK